MVFDFKGTFAAIIGSVTSTFLNGTFDSAVAECAGTIIASVINGISFESNPSKKKKFQKLLQSVIFKSLKASRCELKVSNKVQKIISGDIVKHYFVSEKMQVLSADSINRYLSILLHQNRIYNLNPNRIRDVSYNIWMAIGDIIYKNDEMLERYIAYNSEQCLSIMQHTTQVMDEHDRKLDIIKADTARILHNSERIDQHKSSIGASSQIPTMSNGDCLFREEIVQNIKKMLVDGSNVMISGLGGLGKSTVALKICHELKANATVAWLVYINSLDDSLLSLSIAYEEQINNDDDKLHRIKQELRQIEAPLYIFIDNANVQLSQQELHEIGAWSTSVRVLITSRLEYIQGFERVSLTFLNIEECVKLFYHYYGCIPKKSSTDVKEIVKKAGYHTYLIKLISMTALAENHSIKDTLSILTGHGFCYSRATITRVGSDMASAIRVLFSISNIDYIKVKILKIFSILPANTAIPNDICRIISEDIDNINWLVDHGWIFRNIGVGYSVHQIVQESVKLQNLLAYSDCEQLINYLQDNNYVTKNLKFNIIANKIAISDSLIAYFRNNIDACTFSFSKLTSNTAHAYCWIGNYEKAVDLYMLAYDYSILLFGSNSIYAVSDLSNISTTFKESNDLDAAYYYGEKAIIMCESIKNCDKETLATTQNNFAVILNARGEFEKAEQYYMASIEYLENCTWRSKSHIAILYNNIAVTYRELLRYDEALSYFNKSRELLEEAFGKEHPDVVHPVENIAIIYELRHEYELALDYYFQVLNMREKALGINHPFTRRTNKHIADTYHKMGDFKKEQEFRSIAEKTGSNKV